MSSKKPQHKSIVIKASEATKISAPEGTIWDYPMPNEDVGVSYQELKGRGPIKGRYFNTVCHEIYFIMSGTAKFFLGNEEHEIVKGDLIIIEPNTPHHLVSSNNITYITITHPNWYEEQYKTVEE